MKSSKKLPDGLPRRVRTRPEAPPTLPEVTSPLLNPPEVLIIPEALNSASVPNLAPRSCLEQQQAKVLRSPATSGWDLPFEQWTQEERDAWDRFNIGQKFEYLIQRAITHERERCAKLAEAAGQEELAAVIRSDKEP